MDQVESAALRNTTAQEMAEKLLTALVRVGAIKPDPKTDELVKELICAWTLNAYDFGWDHAWKVSGK